VPWFLLCIFILCFIGHACVMYPAKGISRLRHYFLLFISSIGSFFALCCLFITLALSLKDNLVVPLAMFTAILCELAFVFCIAKYKVTWIRAFFLLIGLLSVVSVFISISPVSNRFILSSIGFRSPGPVSILMEANAAGAFKDIPDVTAEARGEYLLIKNVGIAFRSGSLTIVEAPYAKSGAPAKGNQLIHIKSDDVKAIAQNAQVTGQSKPAARELRA